MTKDITKHRLERAIEGGKYEPIKKALEATGAFPYGQYPDAVDVALWITNKNHAEYTRGTLAGIEHMKKKGKSHFTIKDYSFRMATIHRMHGAGKKPREIAETVGMSANHVRRIIADELDYVRGLSQGDDENRRALEVWKSILDEAGQ